MHVHVQHQGIRNTEHSLEYIHSTHQNAHHQTCTKRYVNSAGYV